MIFLMTAPFDGLVDLAGDRAGFGGRHPWADSLAYLGFERRPNVFELPF